MSFNLSNYTLKELLSGGSITLEAWGDTGDWRATFKEYHAVDSTIEGCLNSLFQWLIQKKIEQAKS